MEVAVVMVSLVISFSDNDEFSSSPVLIAVVPSSSIISETKSWKGSVKNYNLSITPPKYMFCAQV